MWIVDMQQLASVSVCILAAYPLSNTPASTDVCIAGVQSAVAKKEQPSLLFRAQSNQVRQEGGKVGGVREGAAVV
jgi:hypothetical protein